MIEDPKVGQLVYLNSGSPPLTITATYDEPGDTKGLKDDSVQVRWIGDSNHHPNVAIFPTECLKELPSESV